MAALEPLPMSQKKEDLIKHLNMGPDTYTKMAVSEAYAFTYQRTTPLEDTLTG